MTELLNTVLARSASLVATTLLCASPLLSAHAGNMYVYKDDSGQVLLTNVKPSDNSKFAKKVQVTYAPASQTDTLMQSNTLTLNPPSYYSNNSNNSSSNLNTIGSGNNAYDHYILASANRNGIDPGLLKAMMHTESSFNPNARSPVGAQGLMQLMPATARRFSVINAWNPAENIEGAAKYVAWLSKRFNGKIEHILAGYNAGEGNVDKYGGVPPFRETRNYVQRVLNRYNTLYKNDSSLFRAGATTVSSEVGIQRATYGAGATSFGTTSNGYTQASFETTLR
ncbi:lytic transglycosylase domain-containing protein [Psychrobacter sp. YP14]|jgi:hypothetical protein|uniref:Lytic transglycosylase, catalytic n=2 Tax=Psychrobacter TaxID=497 RepID=A5WGM0_PSYWF|nr:MULTISPECIES: lytic transglycosylase domain-containing protein [unclassified Psychrobacter]AWT49593.1 lytic transglycosylase domain-containing protein [Psychrobacter sp. YP14]UNK04965.1 lytic transglycosylase domain-containing protein [Psychrobacter sp. PraFG1]